MESEYRNKCDNCKNVGNSVFARIYYKKLKGEWLYLCIKCWDKQTN